MRKAMPLMLVAFMIVASLSLTGCHKLGLVKSTPKKGSSTTTGQ